MAVGGLFVNLCVVTSIVAILLGVIFNQRAWCAICPMGTLQESLGKLGSGRTKAKKPVLKPQNYCCLWSKQAIASIH
ncbi:4Fe-4S binding protein [uncultured Thermosynechococcus sp.]|nr:4Fe-4S binding protein [uncultured Thermosynechococcus sp.]